MPAGSSLSTPTRAEEARHRAGMQRTSSWAPGEPREAPSSTRRSWLTLRPAREPRRRSSKRLSRRRRRTRLGFVDSGRKMLPPRVLAVRVLPVGGGSLAPSGAAPVLEPRARRRRQREPGRAFGLARKLGGWRSDFLGQLPLWGNWHSSGSVGRPPAVASSGRRRPGPRAFWSYAAATVVSQPRF